jgi:hypothetical protein
MSAMCECQTQLADSELLKSDPADTVKLKITTVGSSPSGWMDGGVKFMTPIVDEIGEHLMAIDEATRESGSTVHIKDVPALVAARKGGKK